MYEEETFEDFEDEALMNEEIDSLTRQLKSLEYQIHDQTMELLAVKNEFAGEMLVRLDKLSMKYPQSRDVLERMKDEVLNASISIEEKMYDHFIRMMEAGHLDA